jgi:hypothetical protein
MKILLLNPHIDAEHKLVKLLQARGVAVLIPESPDEAVQMLKLHGSSVELAVIHREGVSEKDPEAGVKLVSKLKADPAQADLPILFTSAAWGDSEFATHQKTADGANAYLHYPFTETQLVGTIEQMFGVKLGIGGATPAPEAKAEPKAAPKAAPKSAQPAAPAPKAAPKPPPAEPPKPAKKPPAESGGLVLEDASMLFARPEKYEASDTSIKLMAPDSEGESAPPAPSESSISLAAPSLDGALESSGPAEISAPAEAPGEALPLESPSSISLEAAVEAPSASLELSAPDASADIAVSGDSGISVDPGDSGDQSALELGGASQGIALGMVPGAPVPESLDELLDAPAAGADESASEGISLDAGLSEPSIPTAASGTLQFGGDDAVQTAEVTAFGELETAVSPAPSGKRGGRRAEPQADDEAELGGGGGVDSQAAEEMPYLFSKGKGRRGSELAFAQPVGDAVVPGGAAQAPDMETLKRYLLLREQDVAVLSTQLKSAQEQVTTVDTQLREERGKNAELIHVTEEQARKIDDFEKDKQAALEGIQEELGELRFQLKAKVDKARLLEAQVREATEEMERLKDRVRSDIRKIRVREKELENRLEIMRKDSEALIAARETKILELKRKLDLLEFNMDLLQDQYAREKDTSGKLRERLAKAAQVVRMAGGMLDPTTGESTPPPGDREAS